MEPSEIVKRLDPSPKFKPRDSVWVIYNRSVVHVEVGYVNIKYCRGGGRKNVFVFSGYDLSIGKPAGEGTHEYYEWELYASKREALKDARWYSTDGFSEEEWDVVVDNPEQINTYREAVIRNELEGLKDLPSNEFIRNFSTIQRHDEMEALLHQCRTDNGLIERDRRLLKDIIKSLCTCSGCRVNPQEYPTLNRILKTLGIWCSPRRRRKNAH